jgi:uncharacterized protein involved in type VI secretion and phage assembly
MSRPDKKYFGKYRGTVVNNVDPLRLGRLQATVSDVLNVAPSSWAMPCVPVGGLQSGQFAVPPVGAGVWIEFEQGDPDFPIWTGCFWGTAAEVPLLAQAVQPPLSGIALQTPGQNGLMISDAPGPAGGLMLKSVSGATILVNDAGIVIQNGRGASIVMAGPTVSINQGALVIT